MRPKDQAALGLAVYAGLRLGELLALDVPAVDLEGGWIYVRRSWDPGAKQFVPPKSRKPRKVPIIDKLAKLLANHFVLLDHPSDGLLFPALRTPNGRLTQQSCGVGPARNGTTPDSIGSAFTRGGIPSPASESPPG
jgi:integrase